MNNAAEQRPRFALLTHLALAMVIAIVTARCLMLETIRGVADVAATPGGTTAPATPGAATSIVLDWLSFVPLLLVLGRRALDRSRVLSFTAAHAFLFALAAWALASVGWADDKFLALISASRIAGGAALFWTSSQLITRPAHLRVVFGLLVGLLLVNVLQGAIYQNSELADLKQYWIANKPQILAEHGWREGDYTAQRFELKLLAGEMLNFSVSTNALGALVVMAALAAIAAAMQRVEDRDDRGFAGALFLAAASSLYVLAHTDSKASKAALGVGIALLIGWRLSRELLARHRRAALVGTLASIALGVAAVIAAGLARGGLPTESLNFRWRYWVGAWPLVRERPFTGVGWDNFADAYLRHRVPAAAEEIQDPHSFPVRWFVELGIVGLALGMSWLIAWTWAATRPRFPSPGTPGEGRGEGLDLSEEALTLTLSRRTERGDQRPMPISRVLLALLLALATTLACAVDFTSDSNYVLLEVLRRSMYLGVIALAIGLVCLGNREIADDPFYVDERPAPWMTAGLFVGVLMMLLQSTIDIALFQPGVWALMMMAMGGLMGQSSGRFAIADFGSRDATPSPVSDRVSDKARRRRCVSARPVWARRVGIAVLTTTTFAWIGAGLLVGCTVLAETFAAEGDALVRRDPRTAYFLYVKATAATAVHNFDYYNKAAIAAASFGDVPVRKSLDFAIEADRVHALSWLTRSRWLASHKDVPPADAQQAIEDFAHAIALNPNDVDLRIEYADLLERFGHRVEAADQLDAALKLDDQLDPAEPKRLELRSPGKRDGLKQRLKSLRGFAA